MLIKSNDLMLSYSECVDIGGNTEDWLKKQHTHTQRLLFTALRLLHQHTNSALIRTNTAVEIYSVYTQKIMILTCSVSHKCVLRNLIS